jgi:glycine cleavage system H protein
VETTLFYKRSTFVTHLPTDRLYSPSHFWLAQEPEGRWRIGFTKFATRMLGEIVDHQWEAVAGSAVNPGQIIGSIEGFKALSDLYCAASGTFIEGNPAIRENIALVGERPYDEGWLYRIEGVPDPKCLSIEAYRALLDSTIDRILEKQISPEE